MVVAVVTTLMITQIKLCNRVIWLIMIKPSEQVAEKAKGKDRAISFLQKKLYSKEINRPNLVSSHLEANRKNHQHKCH